MDSRVGILVVPFIFIEEQSAAYKLSSRPILRFVFLLLFLYHLTSVIRPTGIRYYSLQTSSSDGAHSFWGHLRGRILAANPHNSD
jgi:hypothetical protein